MKKIIGIGIAAMMVMGLAMVANAGTYDANWTVTVEASNSADFSTYMGPTSLRSWATTPTTTPVNTSAAACWAASLVGGQSLSVDQRGSLVDANAPIQFVLGLVAVKFDGSAGNPQPITGMYVRLYNPKNTGTNTKNIFAPLGGETIKVYDYTQGVKGEFLGDILGGTGSTVNGAVVNLGFLTLDKKILVEAAVPGAQPTVPEPGSMVAMMSGLVGLAGFAIRRRK